MNILERKRILMKDYNHDKQVILDADMTMVEVHDYISRKRFKFRSMIIDPENNTNTIFVEVNCG